MTLFETDEQARGLLDLATVDDFDPSPFEHMDAEDARRIIGDMALQHCSTFEEEQQAAKEWVVSATEALERFTGADPTDYTIRFGASFDYRRQPQRDRLRSRLLMQELGIEAPITPELSPVWESRGVTLFANSVVDANGSVVGELFVAGRQRPTQ